MANNRTRKERLSQERKQVAASHAVPRFIRLRVFREVKKWPIYHVAVPIGNALASEKIA